MIKVKIEMVLNDSWDGYIKDGINDDSMLDDLLSTIQDQRNFQEEVLSVTIKSKQLVQKNGKEK